MDLGPGSRARPRETSQNALKLFSRVCTTKTTRFVLFRSIYASKTRVLARVMRRKYHKINVFPHESGGTIAFFYGFGARKPGPTPRNIAKRLVFAGLHNQNYAFCIVSKDFRVQTMRFDTSDATKHRVLHGFGAFVPEKSNIL